MRLFLSFRFVRFMNTHEKRVAALLEYEIMDSPPEQAFDDLTKLTSFICGTPIALITLLDHERQWFKSSFGLSATETPLGHAFCAHAIEQSGIFTVPDATRDARFSANPHRWCTPSTASASIAGS